MWGDEVRDIEAGRKAGISTIAVTWGYNDRGLLAQHDPTYLVETPADLLHIG